MGRFLTEMFTWWNGQTMGTRFYTWRFGTKVGTDEFSRVVWLDAPSRRGTAIERRLQAARMAEAASAQLDRHVAGLPPEGLDRRPGRPSPRHRRLRCLDALAAGCSCRPATTNGFFQ
jgi:hypothetical protein